AVTDASGIGERRVRRAAGPAGLDHRTHCPAPSSDARPVAPGCRQTRDTAVVLAVAAVAPANGTGRAGSPAKADRADPGLRCPGDRFLEGRLLRRTRHRAVRSTP